jgi:hypothetical protein
MKFDAVIVDEAAHLNMDAIQTAIDAMDRNNVPQSNRIWMTTNDS